VEGQNIKRKESNTTLQKKKKKKVSHHKGRWQKRKTGITINKVAAVTPYLSIIELQCK
jgi:hypothetical protein